MDEHDDAEKSVEKAIGRISTEKILDVATGSGGFITFLLDNLKSFAEIIGIDSNEKPLQAARKAFSRGNIHFHQMDAARMSFPDHYFDLVCISNSLHHMGNLPETLSEMKRVCKPGGHIIISEMYRDDQSRTQQTHVDLHHWWAAVDRSKGIIHYDTYTRHEVVEIAREIGLHPLECYDLKDLETDPKDAELIDELDSIINHYTQRAQETECQVELIQRGEQLRRRVHEVGFHAATTLLVLGRKSR